MSSKLQEVVSGVIAGREPAYADSDILSVEMARLIDYAFENRDARPVHPEEAKVGQLVAEAVRILGYEADANVGRDLWELVSEDSQAQWLVPPESIEGVHISLVNVANNMAKGQCYIEFT
ncbi:hypothetical protein [Marinobacter salsuginis]|jgi:hypothetical protein|uniref:hypothetical protein n=1 Tax=Marinobacter salsuginis TaxID=418719 RepID=UPI0010AAB25A|nr:hypothetical protein [Marinobacter salsuginis]|tara:strand:- start:87 stop:446 length:360 start_codon:yes stop_codon:yes gene_type:complete